MDGSEENLEPRPNLALLRYVTGGSPIAPSGPEAVEESVRPDPPIADVGKDVPGTDFP